MYRQEVADTKAVKLFTKLLSIFDAFTYSNFRNGTLFPGCLAKETLTETKHGLLKSPRLLNEACADGETFFTNLIRHFLPFKPLL